MSALPKKKLCWNCEGNVITYVDNCPYCGVYLHAAELEENSNWNPIYNNNIKMEPTSLPYEHMEPEAQEVVLDINKSDSPFIASTISSQLKNGILPLVFLMAGSIFLLFGIVLLLFSHNGTFTLQWQENDSVYFLLFAAPLIGFGWYFLQKISIEEDT